MGELLLGGRTFFARLQKSAFEERIIKNRVMESG